MNRRTIDSVNGPQPEKSHETANDLAFDLVSDALRICDENGWSSIGIDLSSALDKLRALRDSQGE